MARQSSDATNWDALTHAHGSAADVPRHLEGLTSRDSGVREAALEALYDALWNHGRLWPATPAAVPELLALVERGEVPDRSLVVLFLADLGRAASFGDDPEYLDTLEALSAGVPTLERLLGSGDEVERISAIVALAWADAAEDGSGGTVLRQRLARGDEAERLVTVYALAAGRAAPDADTLRPFAASEDPSVALAARIGLARAGDPSAVGDLDPEAYALLAEVASTVAPQALPQPIELLDPTELSGPSVRALAGVLQVTNVHRVALPLVEALLQATMPDGYEEPPDPLQAVVLEATANSAGAWVFEGNTTAALAEHGVDVVDRLDLCARIGIDHSDLPEAEDTQSLLAGSDKTGIRWEELSADQRRTLDRFVVILDQRGWNESRNWHAFVTSGSGLPIHPIGVGRHFNAHAVLEATLWFFDEHVAGETGERVGEPYVRLVVADKAERVEPIAFRCYFGDQLEELLGVIDAQRPTLDHKNFGEFPKHLFGVCQRVQVELADGRVVELRPKARG
jgi:hypothetical protein